MKALFPIIVIFLLGACTCNGGRTTRALLEPIPGTKVPEMIERFRQDQVVLYDKLVEGEDKGTLWSEFKVADLRLLLEQFADDDKVRLVTAANDGANTPTILFQIVSGTQDAPVHKFYQPLNSGVCPEPIGCAGEVHPQNK